MVALRDSIEEKTHRNYKFEKAIWGYDMLSSRSGGLGSVEKGQVRLVQGGIAVTMRSQGWDLQPKTIIRMGW